MATVLGGPKPVQFLPPGSHYEEPGKPPACSPRGKGRVLTVRCPQSILHNTGLLSRGKTFPEPYPSWAKGASLTPTCSSLPVSPKWRVGERSVQETLSRTHSRDTDPLKDRDSLIRFTGRFFSPYFTTISTDSGMTAGRAERLRVHVRSSGFLGLNELYAQHGD